MFRSSVAGTLARNGVETMELTPEAKAIAQLDAICDQFEGALHAGDVDLDAGQSDSLDGWVKRAAPPWQSWLREELAALREERRRSLRQSHDSSDDVPDDVCRDAWRAVSRCPTFEDLSYELRLALSRLVESRRFDTGSVLLRSGQPASGLYLITEGRVQVAQGENADIPDGGRREIDSDEAGALLGEMSLLTGYPCSADVVATTPVRAMMLPLAAFDSLRGASPELEIALSRLVSQRLGHHRHDALCGKSLGGYRLQRCIGRGAMGVVYEAVRESDQAPCALKMLPHRFLFRPDVVSRFEQETELLRQLEHPNIVAFRGHFVAYRTRFIGLELYDGADLQTVIRRLGGIGEATARAVLGQIASGLIYAHGEGVLHLDLKPANILVNQAGRVAITDFGLSRLIESESEDRTLVGTPVYMPPEQFLMEDVGPHCDWYAFGCIMHELLTGKRLFRDNDSSALLDAKFSAPTSASPLVDQGDDDLLACLRGALEPMVKDRRLDLELVATWARPVPELAVLRDELPSTISG